MRFDGTRTFISILIISILLQGCSQQDEGEDKLDNYLERLARTLNVDMVSLPQTSAPPLPKYQWGFSGRLDTKASSTINILEFLSLYGCDLQLIIAKKNSSLGKFAPNSQELIRILRFLRHAPACITQLRSNGKTDLADQLEKEQNAKKQDLPVLIWQAILNDQEAKAFWKPPAQLGTYPKEIGIDPELAVNRLNYLSEQWLKGDYLYGINELEKLLGDLRLGDGGALMKASQVLHHKLERGDKIIEQYLAAEKCIGGKSQIDETILNNVIAKYFAGNVQTWAAQLSKRYYSLIHNYQSLEQALNTVESELYQAWRNKRDSLLDRNIKSPVRHVKQLQEALNRCKQ